MRRFLLLLLLLLLPLQADAGWYYGATAAAPACTTAADVCAGQQDKNIPVGGTVKYYSTMFVAAATTTLCKFTVKLKEVGSFPGSIYLSVWTDDGGDSPTDATGEIDESTDTAESADIGDTYGDVTFENISVPVTQGTKYHVVLRSTTSDAANYVAWAAEVDDCAPAGNEDICYSASGASWSAYLYNEGGEFQAYK